MVDYTKYETWREEALTEEVERLTLADRQWADHVRRLAEDNERLREALQADPVPAHHVAALRVENERLKREVDYWVNLDAVALEAENERLRAGLRRMVAYAGKTKKYVPLQFIVDLLAGPKE